jgi:hypothetical protein
LVAVFPLDLRDTQQNLVDGAQIDSVAAHSCIVFMLGSKASTISDPVEARRR